MVPNVFVSSSVIGPVNGVLVVLAMVTTKLHSQVVAPFFVHGSPILVIFRLLPVVTGGGPGMQFGLLMKSIADAVSSDGARLSGLPPAGTTSVGRLGKKQEVLERSPCCPGMISAKVTDWPGARFTNGRMQWAS